MNLRNIRVPRRDDYEKRPVLSATIHPDIKRTLLDISERTGMSVSQVSDEVLYTGLVEMQEMDAPGEAPRSALDPAHFLHLWEKKGKIILI